MGTDRSWMYNRLNSTGKLLPEFITGVKEFVDVAISNPSVLTILNGKQCIICPCKKCDNLYNKDLQTVRIHLYKSGFREGYRNWHAHGEEHPNSSFDAPHHPPSETMNDNYQVGEDMVRAAAGQDFDWEEDKPTGMAKRFFDMIAASNTPLWEENMTGELKCESHTILSAVTHALALKSEHQLSQKCFDGMMGLIKSMLPPSEKMPENFYQAKRLTEPLGMEHENIDVCPNFCMLYYKDRAEKTKCDECGEPRYKPSGPNKNAKPVAKKTLRFLPITPRLQKLYMTRSNAVKMRWHKEGFREKPGIMLHPSDGEAWKYFERKYPEFAKEVRNVWMGITTDGFMPFNSSAAPYSCWPVLVFPYNLPPGMIMKEDTMFLALVIPGPKHPGRDIDILLEPLIDELNKLWKDGAKTWDVSRQENFNMHATLLWSINDYPAFEMLSGWGTKG
ncbi:uncharacterized protein LOC144561406 [Carex rostrata]